VTGRWRSRLGPTREQSFAAIVVGYEGGALPAEAPFVSQGALTGVWSRYLAWS
jgi:hypothetical protein